MSSLMLAMSGLAILRALRFPVAETFYVPARRPGLRLLREQRQPSP